MSRERVLQILRYLLVGGLAFLLNLGLFQVVSDPNLLFQEGFDFAHGEILQLIRGQIF